MHKPILNVLLFKVDFFGLLKDSWTQIIHLLFLQDNSIFAWSRRIFNFTTIFIFRAQVTIKFDSIVKAQHSSTRVATWYCHWRANPSFTGILTETKLRQSYVAPVEFQDHPPQQLQLCVCCNSTILLGGLLDSSFLLLEILCFVFPVHIDRYIIVSVTIFSVLLSFGFLTSCFCLCTQTICHWHQLKLNWNM